MSQIQSFLSEFNIHVTMYVYTSCAILISCGVGSYHMQTTMLPAFERPVFPILIIRRCFFGGVGWGVVREKKPNYSRG